MSYKLGLILSFPFLILVILFLGDLGMIGVVRQELDALGTTVSYRIAMEGRISDGTRALAEQCSARIVLESTETPRIGDTVVYTLERDYQPMILRSDAMTIRSTRSCVVGYYDN